MWLTSYIYIDLGATGTLQRIQVHCLNRLCYVRDSYYKMLHVHSSWLGTFCVHVFNTSVTDGCMFEMSILCF